MKHALPLPEGDATQSNAWVGDRWPVTGAKLLAVILASRLWFFLVGFAAYRLVPRLHVITPPGYTLAANWTPFTPWANWDGLWYFSIAQWGYAGRPQSTAFFPLYPWLIRITGASVPIAVLLSMGFLLAAAVLLYALCRLEWGPRTAWTVVSATAFFPTAFYFGAVYPESLFLALSVGAVYAARRERWALAGVLGGLASLCSIYGLLLVIPFGLLLWRSERRVSRLWLWMGCIPLGLVAYMAYLDASTGSALMFFGAQVKWGRHLAPLWATARLAVQSIAAAHRTVTSGFFSLNTVNGSLAFANADNLLFTLGAVATFVLGVRRLPAYLWIYAAAALAVPLSDPALKEPLMSMPRLTLDIFPLFCALGLILVENPRWVRCYYALALPLGALLTALFVTGRWVA